jgi:hypothetical protein
VWRVKVAIEAERTYGMVLPKNDREWRFCAIFAREALRLAMANGGRVTNAIKREAGSTAVREANYREKHPRAVETRAEEQLSLPRTQAGIMEIFKAAGVDVASIASTFAEILGAPLDGESGVTAGDKIKVAEVFFKVTTGFAPTKNANINANVPVDAFYDPDAYTKTPPIKTVSK